MSATSLHIFLPSSPLILVEKDLGCAGIWSRPGVLSQLPGPWYLGAFGTLLGPLPKGRLLVQRCTLDHNSLVIAGTSQGLGLRLSILSNTNTHSAPRHAFDVAESIWVSQHAQKQLFWKSMGNVFEKLTLSARYVDSESPVFVLQILMVLSLLPLAIFAPSGLHATDQDLRLRWD